MPEAKEKSEPAPSGGFLRGLIQTVLSLKKVMCSILGIRIGESDTCGQEVADQEETTKVRPLDSNAIKSEIFEPLKRSCQHELAGQEVNKVGPFEPTAMVNEIFKPVKPFQENWSNWPRCSNQSPR